MNQQSNYTAYSVTYPIIEQTARERQVVLGITPTPTHSWDLRNLLEHSVGCARKNIDLKQTKNNELAILKSKRLLNKEWNDQVTIESVNRFSRFRRDIIAYKENLREVIQNLNDRSLSPRFLYDLQESSKLITDNILKSVYYSHGRHGVHTIQNHISTALETNKYDPDILKVYNIIIYSAPFALYGNFQGMTTTPDMIYHTPYELILNNLHFYINSFPFQDLTYMLKAQLRLENTLYSITTPYKELYNTLFDVYYNSRDLRLLFLRIGASMLSAGLLSYILTVTESGAIAGDDALSVSIPGVPELTPEDVDHIVRQILDFHQHV